MQLESAVGEKIPSWFVLGEVVAVHIDKALLKDGVYQTAEAEHVLRGGGPADYFSVRPEQLFKLYRPR
jgi:flavin reductase (DIM6/NTAB) family NADH-FMN oxidoreductase RutF